MCTFYQIDNYIAREWFNRRALNLVRELKVENAVEVALRLNDQIEKGLLEALVKLTPAQVTVILVWKFMEDPYFRASSVNISKLVAKRRAMQQLIWRIRRKTY